MPVTLNMPPTKSVNGWNSASAPSTLLQPGSRQAGRIICQNVLCCAAAAPAIEAALRRALTPEFSAVAHAAQSPYDGGDTSGKICRVLAQFDFAKPKTFYDGPVPEFNPKRSISL